MRRGDEEAEEARNEHPPYNPPRGVIVKRSAPFVEDKIVLYVLAESRPEVKLW